MKRTSLAIVGLFVTGCGMDTGADFQSASSALTGEIGPVSEEVGKSYAYCSEDNVGVTAARCVGKYCDDMYLTCSRTPAGFTTSAAGADFVPYFSDETPARYCSPDGTPVNINGIVEGIHASGKYSDNIWIHCAPILSGHLTNCTWSGWFSEEEGSESFGGRFAVGAQCQGSFCDWMRYYICDLTS